VITQAALGDTISWEIAPIGYIVFLKPREAAKSTNLIVLTNANGVVRSYSPSSYPAGLLLTLRFSQGSRSRPTEGRQLGFCRKPTFNGALGKDCKVLGLVIPVLFPSP
jgi:hypothetical protein